MSHLLLASRDTRYTCGTHTYMQENVHRCTNKLKTEKKGSNFQSLLQPKQTFGYPGMSNRKTANDLRKQGGELSFRINSMVETYGSYRK